MATLAECLTKYGGNLDAAYRQQLLQHVKKHEAEGKETSWAEKMAVSKIDESLADERKSVEAQLPEGYMDARAASKLKAPVAGIKSPAAEAVTAEASIAVTPAAKAIQTKVEKGEFVSAAELQKNPGIVQAEQIRKP